MENDSSETSVKKDSDMVSKTPFFGLHIPEDTGLTIGITITIFGLLLLVFW